MWFHGNWNLSLSLLLQSIVLSQSSLVIILLRLLSWLWCEMAADWCITERTVQKLHFLYHHYVPSVVNRSAVMDLHRSRSCATLIQSLYDIFVHSFSYLSEISFNQDTVQLSFQSHFLHSFSHNFHKYRPFYHSINSIESDGNIIVNRRHMWHKCVTDTFVHNLRFCSNDTWRSNAVWSKPLEHHKYTNRSKSQALASHWLPSMGVK